jgi:hypothetical protein
MKKAGKHTRRNREQWQALVEEWRGSGVKANEFALSRGLSTTSLYYWSSLLARTAQAPTPKLLPVRVAPQAARSFDLELAVGPARVRFEEGTAPAYVGALARALLEATSR